VILVSTPSRPPHTQVDAYFNAMHVQHEWTPVEWKAEKMKLAAYASEEAVRAAMEAKCTGALPNGWSEHQESGRSCWEKGGHRQYGGPRVGWGELPEGWSQVGWSISTPEPVSI